MSPAAGDPSGPLYEFATYVAAPGQLPQVGARYASEVLPGLGSCGRHLAGAWTTELGPLSRLVTLCAVAPGAIHVPPGDEAFGQVTSQRRLCRLMRPLSTDMPCGVVEFRTYTAAPGQQPSYLDRMLAHLHLRERHSRNIGVWSPVGGRLDQVLHLWGYTDIQHRMQVRAAALADPAWRGYLTTVYPMLAEMESTVLIPTTFSPLR